MKLKFLVYGLLGWGMEITWTGLGAALKGDPRLTATTYLWMFPIYGLAVFLEPLHEAVRGLPWYVRGIIWLLAIWLVEYTAGSFIRAIVGVSPWNYAGRTPWHISGLVRLDMAPVWFAVGLMFERVHDYLDRFLAVR